MTEDEIKSLCDRIREIAFDIHVFLGHGHFEKVYENTLAHRLKKYGYHVGQQQPISVFDENGALVGEYAADLLVEGILIIEIKAAKTIAPEHEVQILGYLKGCRLEHGLLINFGSHKFEIRKYILQASPGLKATRNARNTKIVRPYKRQLQLFLK